MTPGILDNVFVDRQMWLRGEGAGDSFLLRAGDQKRCCLGFASQQLCDISDDAMLDVRCPRTWWDGVDAEYTAQPAVSAQPITSRLMDANDNFTLSETERELRIRALGKQIGIHFIFWN